MDLAFPYTLGASAITEDENVQAVLKRLYSTDLDAETYLPDEVDNFGFVLRAMIGPMGEEGEDSFDITVCTPRWLIERYGTSEVLLGLHKLIVFRYDYVRLKQFIEKYLMRCSGDNWEKIAQK